MHRVTTLMLTRTINPSGFEKTIAKKHYITLWKHTQLLSCLSRIAMKRRTIYFRRKTTSTEFVAFLRELLFYPLPT